MSGKKLSIMAAACLLASQVIAQQRPDSGDLLRQQQQGIQQPALSTDPVLPEDVEKAPKSNTDLPGIDDPFQVSKFDLSGVIVALDPARLRSVLSAWENKTLTLRDLLTIRDSLVELYRQDGYFLAKVILPPQDVTAGTVSFHVEEGYLDHGEGRFTIDSSKARLSDNVTTGYLDSAIPSDRPMNKADIERAILLMRDIPGVNASVNMAKGSQPGTTRLVSTVNEGKTLNPWIGFDNGGGRLTGVWRTTAGLDINDVLGQGEQVSVLLSKSFTEGDMEYGRVQLKMPLGYSGLQWVTALDYLEYAIGEELESTNADGTASSFSMGLKYPVIRSRDMNFFVSADAQRRRTVDRTNDAVTNKKHSHNGRIGVQFDMADKILLGGHSLVDLGLNYGRLDLKEDSVRSTDGLAGGAGTNGNFRKLDFHLRRTQRNTPDFYMFADIRGQIGGNNLDNSEKFSLGGSSGVRAWPGNEGQGDTGILVQVEAHYGLPELVAFGNVELFSFFDWGRVRQFHDFDGISSDSPNIFNLAGYGLGATLRQPGNFDISLTIANPMGHNPGRSVSDGKNSDGSKEGARAWLSVVKYF